jgi:hypothetical protein
LNILKKTTKPSAIFLAIVLVAGTIAAISPSFVIGAEAQAEREYRYNSYEPEPTEYSPPYTDRQHSNYPSEYEMDSYEKKSYGNDYYEQPEYPSYEDNNSYKSKKDSSSKSVSINKLKCINNNVNINGNNTGSINVGNSGRSASSPGTDEGYLGVGSLGGNGEDGYDNGYNKQKDKGFSCIINNNNNNTIVTVNATDDGDNVAEPTATLAVTKTTRCNPIPVASPAADYCNTLETNISPDDFNIVVTGNDPDPDEFPGSNTPPGVIVTLGAGGYQVTEELPIVPPPPNGVTVSRTTTFAGNCVDVAPSDPGSIVAAGTIEAGEEQTCDIDNLYEARATAGGLTSSNINTDTSAFDINTAGDMATSDINTGDIAPSFSSPPTIAQGVENSAGLTSLEKITKLKQQWLDLLP